MWWKCLVNTFAHSLSTSWNFLPYVIHQQSTIYHVPLKHSCSRDICTFRLEILVQLLFHITCSFHLLYNFCTYCSLVFIYKLLLLMYLIRAQSMTLMLSNYFLLVVQMLHFFSLVTQMLIKSSALVFCQTIKYIPHTLKRHATSNWKKQWNKPTCSYHHKHKPLCKCNNVTLLQIKTCH